jgi:hypothetical protein
LVPKNDEAVSPTGEHDEFVRKFDRADQRILAAGSLDCAERVLPRFELARPDHSRPRHALEVGRRWVETGEFSMRVIRSASLGAHVAAKEATNSAAACAAAHAAGQAVAAAHVARHASGGAYDALKPLAADSGGERALDRVVSERGWQAQHLPEPLRSGIVRRLVVEDRRSGPFITAVKGPGF